MQLIINFIEMHSSHISRDAIGLECDNHLYTIAMRVLQFPSSHPARRLGFAEQVAGLHMPVLLLQPDAWQNISPPRQ
jgi:hypothetical protein